MKKRAAFRTGFAGFEIDKVAGFGARDVTRHLADAGIIRNRFKIEAVIENARRLQAIRNNHGSFVAWLDVLQRLPRPALGKKNAQINGKTQTRSAEKTVPAKK